MSTAAILGELDVMAQQERDDAIATAVEILQTGKMPDHEEIHVLCIKLGIPTHEFRQLAGVLSQRITNKGILDEAAPDLAEIMAAIHRESAERDSLVLQLQTIDAKLQENGRTLVRLQSDYRSQADTYNNRQTQARQHLLKTADPRLTRQQERLRRESAELTGAIDRIQHTIERTTAAAEQAQTMAEQMKRWQKSKSVLVEDPRTKAMELPGWMLQIRTGPGNIPATPEFVAKAEQLLERLQRQGNTLADHRAELVRLQTRLAEIENEWTRLEAQKLLPESIAWGNSPALVKSDVDDRDLEG